MKGGDNVAKQTEFTGIKPVDLRIKIAPGKRDKLNIIAAVNKTTVTAILEEAIDKIIAEDEGLRVLKEAGKA